MGIVNKRNAVIGWTVLKLGKRTAKKKAKGVVPMEGRSKLSAGAAAAVAAFVGVFAFWRSRKSGNGSD